MNPLRGDKQNFQNETFTSKFENPRRSFPKLLAFDPMTGSILILFFFILGSCVGSFLNVCIYRLPQNLSIAYPRSFCPRCNKPIRAYDNIPLLSYLFLRGRCRHCGEKISWRYPLVEALTGGFALALFCKFGLTLSFFSFFAFAAALIVITFIDLNHRIIPDMISLPGIGIGVLLSFFLPFVSVMDSLIGLAAGGGRSSWWPGPTKPLPNGKGWGAGM